jgi:ABC-2 type transport system permease protein
MFPPTGLPWWLRLLVRINPLTYGVDLIRRLVLGFSYYSPWFDFGFLAAFGALATFAAVFFFTRGEY